MALALLNRVTIIRSTAVLNSWSKGSGVSLSKASMFTSGDRAYSVSNRLHLSPLFPENKVGWLKDCKIEIMDDETWRLSLGLLDTCRGNTSSLCPISREHLNDGDDNLDVNSVTANKEEPCFDEIEDMRIHRNLFYKIDKDSKEYEEYAFDFHRRKSPNNEKNRKESKNKKKENPTHSSGSRAEKVLEQVDQRENKKTKDCKIDTLMRRSKDGDFISKLHAIGDSCIKKKQRTLTFNQLTDAYHEPFCLDIYISKGSVRASIIHRATSKVIVVSHSISKDMKFDLGSTKNKNACAAVGEALAQRALADDIHNAVYTPRKGDKLEGKLQIVLNSVIDGGVNVKVKLKQKNLRKSRDFPMKTQR